ncbi:MAG TPA: hypothetical protein VKE51_04085 [Vicinamibacterales bacterium]|nr:hypothetical protein [Vicinamibacterales bacterium]
MADVRREDKQLKRYQRASRDVRDEVAEQIRDGADSRPLIKHPNRDQARGDWDRTGLRRDEGIVED